MHKIIYLDSLILLNTVVTYILLLAVRAFSSVKTPPFRLIGASFGGGAASLLLLAPKLPTVVTVLIRLILCAVLSFIAFFVGDRKPYFRCFVLLLLTTFAFGGCMFCLSVLQRDTVVLQNGFCYVGMNFTGIILTMTGMYFLLLFLRRKLGKGKNRFYYEIELVFSGKKAVGRALYDSGHFVSDCYTGRPVVIAGAQLARQLLTEEELQQVLSVGKLSADVRATGVKARCIPVRTVSGSRLLPAFTCEKAVIRNEDDYRSVADVSLALSEELSDFPGCDALINQKLFESRG